MSKRIRATFPIWFGAIWGGCGVALLAVGASAAVGRYSVHQRLLSEGVFVDGVVLTKSVALGGWNGGDSYAAPTFRLRFRFTAPDGSSLDDTAEVRAPTWRTLGEQRPIRVRYLPADPRQHEVEGQTFPWLADAVLIVLGLVFAATGGVVVVAGYRELGRRRILDGRHNKKTE